MKPKFEKIKEEYELFYKSLLKKGELPMRSTSKGFWGASVADEILTLFKKINLGKHRNFLDLGSGDGKVVLIASLFTNAFGIEFDKDLVKAGENIKKSLKLKADFKLGDFLEEDLSKYAVIFLYPDQYLEKLDRKLAKELKGKLIVYGPHFNPRFLKQTKTHDINGSLVGVYVKKVKALVRQAQTDPDQARKLVKSTSPKERFK